MKTSLLAGYLVLLVSSVSLAQMAQIRQINSSAEQGMVRFSALTEVLASKDINGKIIFSKDESKKLQLAQYQINVSDCITEQQTPAYCLDKSNEEKLISVMRTELVQSIALKNIYLRALRAVGTKEARQELLIEARKDLEARRKISQYTEELKLSKTNRISLNEIASDLGPAIALVTIIGTVYAIPVLIFVSGGVISKMALGITAVALFGGAGGLSLAEKSAFIELKKEQLNQHVRQAEQKLLIDLKYGQIVDEAILESYPKK